MRSLTVVSHGSLSVFSLSILSLPTPSRSLALSLSHQSHADLLEADSLYQRAIESFPSNDVADKYSHFLHCMRQRGGDIPAGIHLPEEAPSRVPGERVRD